MSSRTLRHRAAGTLIAMIPVGAVAAAEIRLVNDATSYPEGPTVVAGDLYYAEMGNDRVMRLAGGANTIFWSRENCAPTSVSAAGGGDVFVLCHRQGSVIRVSAAGATLAVVDRDDRGRAFVNPNGSVADGKGGLWFSSSGQFAPGAPAEGSVLHLAADGRLRRLAEGIRYANGVALSPDGATLYVSEHLERRVLAFAVGADGSLSRRRVVVALDDVVASDPERGWWVGPDGLTVDRAGDIWIAEYGGGRVLCVSPEGKLRATIRVKEPFTTALAFDGDESRLYITAPASRTPFYGGAVYAVDNPLREKR